MSYTVTQAHSHRLNKHEYFKTNLILFINKKSNNLCIVCFTIPV